MQGTKLMVSLLNGIRQRENCQLIFEGRNQVGWPGKYNFGGYRIRSVPVATVI